MGNIMLILVWSGYHYFDTGVGTGVGIVWILFLILIQCCVDDHLRLVIGADKADTPEMDHKN